MSKFAASPDSLPKSNLGDCELKVLNPRLPGSGTIKVGQPKRLFYGKGFLIRTNAFYGQTFPLPGQNRLDLHNAFCGYV